MDCESIIKCVRENGSGTYCIVKNNKKENRRLFYHSIFGLCEYKKGSRKFGVQVYSSETDTWSAISVKQEKSDLEIVKAFLGNAVKYLTASGLWGNILESYKILLAQSDEFIQELISADYTKSRELLNSKNISCFCDDLLTTAKKGIKSINYLSYDKENERKIFKESFKNEKEYNYSWEKGYDNSISCRKVGDYMCAWYSEEYRGCGNGHYYLALDEKHAMFCEDD